jgi:hypothetical protein
VTDPKPLTAERLAAIKDNYEIASQTGFAPGYGLGSILSIHDIGPLLAEVEAGRAAKSPPPPAGELREAKAILCEMRDITFGCSGQSRDQVNDYLNRRAADALAALTASTPTASGEEEADLITELRARANALHRNDGPSLTAQLCARAADALSSCPICRGSPLMSPEAHAEECWIRNAIPLTTPPTPGGDGLREALEYSSVDQIAVCRCGSFPTLYSDGARPDDGYRSLWCQGCMEYVTDHLPSAQQAIRAWNTQREAEHAALAHPETSESGQ